eukprot:TRINITY_DN8688_c0_g1_i1.p1 TRINITY_DN8688_c0_g1~~TRINITY_DN8688_c0_g1_i1.p1  ORF type:complete len:409 (-),score=95.14 TRINITY_DN8688_c0_g1_i1:182-1357(-)
MSKKNNPSLPEHIEKQRTRVTIRNQAPKHTETHEYHSLYKHLKYDNSFDIEEFKKNFKINIIQNNPDHLIFDMVGVDPPIANALRRILIAEVPTMAIEDVYIKNNTSIIQDEVLAHRIGLIPIKADPLQFNFRPADFKYGSDDNDGVDDTNTIIFNIDVVCKKMDSVQIPSGSLLGGVKPDQENLPTSRPVLDSDPEKVKYQHAVVYSKDLVWIPQGDQEEKFANNPIKPVEDEIILAKLRPGQEISATCVACKGTGKQHAKWSPVCTASYRLLPEIVIEEDFVGSEAKSLVSSCPMKVFDIEDFDGGKRARVANARNCTMCRECIRDPAWEKKIKLHRVKNHFIFSIESTGVMPAQTIFEEALNVFADKLELLLSELVPQKNDADEMTDA